eukprot:scaffold306201_cov20-Prasinocladus_malaysianus.AAC.1
MRTREIITPCMLIKHQQYKNLVRLIGQQRGTDERGTDLQGDESSSVLGGHQADREPVGLCAGRAARPVHVDVHAGGQLVVNHAPEYTTVGGGRAPNAESLPHNNASKDSLSHVLSMPLCFSIQKHNLFKKMYDSSKAA